MFVSQNKNNLYESELDWSGLSSTETKLHPEISSRVLNENIFLKSTYNATTNPDLIDRLETLDITEVYIAGFETDACVLATAFALFDRGIRPIVIKSCCSSAEPTVHTTALRILQRNIGAQNIITHTEL